VAFVPDDSKTIKAFVDRIESGTAVLEQLDSKMTLNFPVVLLPDSVEEGSVVEVTVKDRPQLAEKRREQIEELQHRLIEQPNDE
jgi:hypothetical protein